MLVVTRYTVKATDGPEFLEQVRTALAAFAACPGHLAGRAGRSTDDPALWLISTEWVNVGAYRRALSSYDVKVHAIPLMYRAQDEPSAYELLASAGPGGDEASGPRSRRAADAGTIGVGQASGPLVPSDLD